MSEVWSCVIIDVDVYFIFFGNNVIFGVLIC